MADAPIAFATPADLSTYSKGQISDSDTRVQDALDGASAAIRQYCGWHIWPPRDETLTVDGPGGRVLSLPTMNVTEVTSIIENGTTLTDGTDYRWSADGSVKRTHCRWTDDYRAIVVRFFHGYDYAADVKQVLLSVVTRALSSPSGATSEAVGPFSVKWATVAPGVSGGLALLGHEISILDAYRIVSV